MLYQDLNINQKINVRSYFFNENPGVQNSVFNTDTLCNSVYTKPNCIYKRYKKVLLHSSFITI